MSGERPRPLRIAFSSARLLIAAKTALAVAIAWAVAQYMPGVTDEYPYYAPLGVLLSMYPTLMESAKSGLQTILALMVGIALALLVIITVGPNWWSIPIVAGVGMLVSGTGWFGAGREYVPIAALFVLIIGGQDSEDFSLGYLTQMAVGIAVGLAVNLLIAPGTLTAAAAARVGTFRGQLASHLHEIGKAISDSWPPERVGWVRDSAALADTSRGVRQALDDADASRKGNPRAMRGRHSSADVHHRLETLELIAVRIRDISETLADAIWERPGGLGLNPALAEPLSEACHRVADCIDRAGEDGDEGHRSREVAAQAVRVLLSAVNGGGELGACDGSRSHHLHASAPHSAAAASARRRRRLIAAVGTGSVLRYGQHMGSLQYGGSEDAIHIEDRALAHLKVVIATKLRRQESFTLSWKHPEGDPVGRSTIWIHPSIPLRFMFDQIEADPLNARWIDELMHTVNSTGGITLVDEVLDPQV